MDTSKDNKLELNEHNQKITNQQQQETEKEQEFPSCKLPNLIENQIIQQKNNEKNVHEKKQQPAYEVQKNKYLKQKSSSSSSSGGDFQIKQITSINPANKQLFQQPYFYNFESQQQQSQQSQQLQQQQLSQINDLQNSLKEGLQSTHLSTELQEIPENQQVQQQIGQLQQNNNKQDGQYTEDEMKIWQEKVFNKFNDQKKLQEQYKKKASFENSQKIGNSSQSHKIKDTRNMYDDDDDSDQSDLPSRSIDEKHLFNFNIQHSTEPVQGINKQPHQNEESSTSIILESQDLQKDKSQSLDKQVSNLIQNQDPDTIQKLLQKWIQTQISNTGNGNQNQESQLQNLSQMFVEDRNQFNLNKNGSQNESRYLKKIMKSNNPSCISEEDFQDHQYELDQNIRNIHLQKGDIYKNVQINDSQVAKSLIVEYNSNFQYQKQNNQHHQELETQKSITKKSVGNKKGADFRGLRSLNNQSQVQNLFGENKREDLKKKQQPLQSNNFPQIQNQFSDNIKRMSFNQLDNLEDPKIFTKMQQMSSQTNIISMRNIGQSLALPNKNMLSNNKPEEQIYVVRTMGQGAYGTVHFVITGLKNFFARKTFNQEKYYEQEKNKYKYIQKMFKKIEDFCIPLNENQIQQVDDQKQQKKYQIFYGLGSCSLTEFNNLRQQNNCRWTDKELYYLFKQLYNFVYEFNKPYKFEGFKLMYSPKFKSEYIKIKNRTIYLSSDKSEIDKFYFALLEVDNNSKNENYLLETEEQDKRGCHIGKSYKFSFKIVQAAGKIGLGIIRINDLMDLRKFELSAKSGTQEYQCYNILFNDNNFIRRDDMGKKEKGVSNISFEQGDIGVNISLDVDYDSQETYFPFVLFLAGAQTSIDQVAFTKLYYGNSEDKISNHKQRFVTEVYTILRTLMKLLISWYSPRFHYVPFVFENLKHQEIKIPYKFTIQCIKGGENDNSKIGKMAIASIERDRNNNNQITNSKEYQFSFNITELNKNSIISVGVCDKKWAEEIKYEYNYEKAEQAYLISSNGTYCSTEGLDGEFKGFKQGDTVLIEVKKRKIEFKIKDSSQYVEPKKCPKFSITLENERKINQLVPCCILQQTNDKVKFELGPNIGRLFNSDKQTTQDNLNILTEFQQHLWNEDHFQKNTEFQKFFKFLQDVCGFAQLTTGNYDKEKIYEYINSLDTNDYILDEKDLIKEYISKQNRDLDLINQKNVFSKIFDELTYIDEVYCSKNDNENQDYLLLLDQVGEFLSDFGQAHPKQVFILVGDGGTGKSSFVRNLEKRIRSKNAKNKDNKEDSKFKKIFRQCNIIPLMINMNVFKRKENTNDLKSYFNKLAPQSNSSQYVFFLDGYEELSADLQGEFLDLIEIFSLKNTTNRKIIMTSRKEGLPYSDLDQIFKYDEKNYMLNKEKVLNNIEYYFMGLFQQVQINKYLKNLYDFKNLEQNNFHLYFNIFEEKSQYESKLIENPELYGMAQNPLLLRIIVEVLPTIEDKIKNAYQDNSFDVDEKNHKQQVQSKYYSKYYLYKTFIKTWIEKIVQKHVEESTKHSNKDQKKTQIDQKIKFIWNLNLKVAYKLFESEKSQFDEKFAKSIPIDKMNPISDLELNNNNNYNENLNNDKNSNADILHNSDRDENKPWYDPQDIEDFLKSSPLALVDQQYEYMHKSVLEFFIAFRYKTDLKRLIKNVEAQKSKNQNQNTSLKSGSLNIPSEPCEETQSPLTNISNLSLNMPLKQTHIPIIKLIQNYFIQVKFLKYIRESVENPQMKIVAVNCATLANALNLSFSGLDLSKSNLEGAILQQAILHKTNLEGTNLQEANLSDAILIEADLTNAKLNKAQLGLSLNFEQNKPVQNIKYTPDGNYLVCTNEQSIILYQTQNAEKMSLNYDQTNLNKHDFQDFDQGENCIDISQDSNWVVAGTFSGTLYIWNLVNNKFELQKTMKFTDKKLSQSQPKGISQIALSKNPKYQEHFLKIVVGFNDGSFQILEYYFSSPLFPEQFNPMTPIMQSQNSKVNKSFIIEQNEDTALIRGKQIKTESSSCISAMVFYQVLSKLDSHYAENLAIGTEDSGIIYIYETSNEWNNKSMYDTKLFMIKSIAVSNNNKYMAASSIEGMVFYQYITSKENNNKKSYWRDIKHINSGALCLSFTGDSRIVASGDRIIKLWNILTGEMVSTIEADTQVNSINFSPLDNTLLATGSYDNRLKIYKFDESQKIKELQGHDNDVTVTAISDSGSLLASGDRKGNVILWNLETGFMIQKKRKMHAHSIQCMLFVKIKSGQYGLRGQRNADFYDYQENFYTQQVLCTSGGSIAKIWNLNSGQQETLYGHQEQITSVGFSQNLRLLATGSYDGTIIFWDLDLTQKSDNLPQNSSINTNFSKKRNKDLVYTNKSKRNYYQFTLMLGSGVNCLGFSEDGLLVIGCEDLSIRIYQVQQTYVKQKDGVELVKFAEYLYQFDQNFLDNMEEELLMRSIKTQHHQGSVLCIAISQDGSNVATAGSDQNIKIWYLEDEGNFIRDIPAQNGDIKSLIYLPEEVCKNKDGEEKKVRFLASSGSNFQIRIWNEDTGEMVGKILGHTSTITSLSISFNGEYLASAAQGLKIWKIHKEQNPYKIDYLLHRNISLTQAFQCEGVIFKQDKNNSLILSAQDKLNQKILKVQQQQSSR
ncbi:WD40-repeat-containing domain [Pseudocohnilembus persalinus]|uniref:WD40-repeat-containing domain n=1 Tax=Pseudocohnilembus persalinus TaxID=266149 RepID=A0A0V0R6V6_PSEPJ|nr:WD40-repeat-containing domain [Pseudocohnilembus persalinus]|eukprot:KRX10222.1 WD40-repeat-containing domain [Pseudocohnilembus persalinus]